MPALATPVSEVGMIPYAGNVPHVEDLLRRQWGNYYNTRHVNGFGADSVRVGRYDLDDDEAPEIFVMVDAPNWGNAQGNPFVIGEWNGERWVIVGAGYASSSTIFIAKETTRGWRNIELPDEKILKWNGRAYR